MHTAVSDDVRLELRPDLTGPIVVAEFDAVLPSDQPSALSVRLEAAANTIGLEQTIEMFDFLTGKYQQVDSRDAAIVDSIVDYTADKNIARFVEAGTAAVRVRVSWTINGITLQYPWTVSIDQLVWLSAD